MVIAHYKEVDKERIDPNFFDGVEPGTRHRSSLYIPFKGRIHGRTICIIGQNPSDANKEISDKTITYMERLIYETFSDVAAIIVLNLFSLVDIKQNKQKRTYSL